MDLLSYRTLGAEAPLSRRMPERVLHSGTATSCGALWMISSIR